MRKIRDVLERIFKKELSPREITHLIRFNCRAVANYSDRFKDSKLPWPLPARVDNNRLGAT